MKKHSKDYIDDLKWEIELRLAFRCAELEEAAEKEDKPFKCECLDPYKLSEEDVIELYEELTKDDV